MKKIFAQYALPYKPPNSPLLITTKVHIWLLSLQKVVFLLGTTFTVICKTNSACWRKFGKILKSWRRIKTSQLLPFLFLFLKMVMSIDRHIIIIFVGK